MVGELIVNSDLSSKGKSKRKGFIHKERPSVLHVSYFGGDGFDPVAHRLACLIRIVSRRRPLSHKRVSAVNAWISLDRPSDAFVDGLHKVFDRRNVRAVVAAARA